MYDWLWQHRQAIAGPRRREHEDEGIFQFRRRRREEAAGAPDGLHRYVGMSMLFYRLLG